MPRARERKGREYRRKMKLKDRKDDIPDCPSLQSLEVPSEREDRIKPPIRETPKQDTGEDISVDPVVPIDPVVIRPLEVRAETNRIESPIRQVQTTPGETFESSYGAHNNTSGAWTPSAPTYLQQSTSESQQQPQQASTPSSEWQQTKFTRYARRSKGPDVKLLSENVTKGLEAFGGIALDFFMYVFGMLRYTIEYPTPFAIGLMICGAYFTFLYLELSLMALIELLISTTWPMLRVSLRTTERIFKHLSSFINTADDLGESMYCDTALMFCSRFDLMCDNKCSFTAMALERLRQDH